MCKLRDRLGGRVLILCRVVSVTWWRPGLDRRAAGMGVAFDLPHAWGMAR